MRQYNRFETVELVIPAGNEANQVNFDPVPELLSDGDRDAVIFAIGSYSQESLPKTQGGNTMATMAQCQNAFLTLYALGSNQLWNIPVIDFINIQNSSASYFNAREFFECAPIRVDWQKSYVSFAVPGLSNTPQYSFLFKFAYEWMPPGSYANYVKRVQNKWSLGSFGPAAM